VSEGATPASFGADSPAVSTNAMLDADEYDIAAIRFDGPRRRK
jgi:hypothetical protein